MFKVKEIKTGKIITVLGTYCDEFGKAWFLMWKDKWIWRAADNYYPPNYIPKLRTIVAGSRIFDNYKIVCETLDPLKDTISEIVCGEAKGADTLGRNWAIGNNIKITSFPANWERDGNRAGMIRNHEMGDYADRLIAFWNGTSPGTKDMIDYMKKLKKEVIVINV